MRNIITVFIVISLVLVCCKALGQAPGAPTPILGNATFFIDVKNRLARSKSSFYLGSFYQTALNNGNLGVGQLGFGNYRYIVFNADLFKMKTYLVPTSGVGTVIDDVVADPSNSAAVCIINGAQFSYGTSNHPNVPFFHPSPNQEPMVTIGNVVSGGNIISTNSSHTGPGTARATAVIRYWLAENYSINDAGGAWSFLFSEPPAGKKGDPPLVDAGLGGLLSLIMPYGHPQTVNDDKDLSLYDAVRLSSRPSIGQPVGFNIIGVNRATGMIIILTKDENSLGSIFAAQSLLHGSQTDLALVTDGGGSTGCWFSSQGVVSRGHRQVRGNADKNNTVTNYLIFVPK